MLKPAALVLLVTLSMLALSMLALSTPALPTSALAQPASAHLRGTIAAVDGSTLTIKPAEGAAYAVHLAPDAKVIATRKASLADIKQGSYVGIANVGEDGKQDALEVHIFTEAMRGTGDGQRGWDLGKKSRMTNGAVGKKVEAYDGQNLVVDYKGGQSTIQVRPNTPVVAFAPGTMADLKSGATIFVRDGKPASEGSFDASAVVVGTDGSKPPM